MERCSSITASANPLVRLLSVSLLAGALGCSNGESPNASIATEPKAKPSANSATPERTIHEFMMAFKNGDDAKAAELITAKARQEAERTGKAVSPPGSKTMRFTVSGVEYVSEAKDAAHVSCQISDIDPANQEVTMDVVWFLRKETRGWRVAGVAMKPFPDQLPVLYNFEDQDDMDRKVQLVSDEMGRREQAEVERAKATLMQAQQPPAETTRKQ